MDEKNEKDIVNLEIPEEDKDTQKEYSYGEAAGSEVSPLENGSSSGEEEGRQDTPSGHGEDIRLDTPPDYGQNAGPDAPPPDYGQNAGPGVPPSGYGERNWQHTASGYGQGSGPGTPPPGYGNNGWQGTPPPGYGYGRPNRGGYPPYNGPRQNNNMAMASLILGILSIVLCCCGGFGVILGAVGIVLAILSRGSEPMETSAKVGLGLSIGGIVLGIAVLAISFMYAGSDQFRKDLNRGGYGNYESYKHYFEHGGL